MSGARVHILRFSPRAVAQWQSANFCAGEDNHLHITVRGRLGSPCLVVNDCIGGQWGAEWHLPLTAAEAVGPEVEVRFTEISAEVGLAGGPLRAFRPGASLPPRLEARHGPEITALSVPDPEGEGSGVSWATAPLRLRLGLVLPTPAGLLLQGWLADPGSAIARIALRREDAEWPISPDAWLDTPDFDADGGRGFVAFAPGAPRAGSSVEATLHSGEVARFPLPAGLSSLRAMLAAAGPLPDGAVGRAFDQVLGPPLLALHRETLARPMTVEERRFGTQPSAPRASVIIPLHGRLDMLDVQMALFSACRMEADEVVFVLDDPPLRAAALAAAQSAWERFAVPLRLILPARSRGFGPACNLGLHRSGGRSVVFLNADAFPQGTDWLDRLVAALAEPMVGAAGARLLYPDGSLQHGGMRIEAAPCGWRFPEHPDKGLRPPEAGTAPRDVEALTGACLALRRDVAERFGGFSEDYVIGDFEDADLCARLRAEGLRCVMEDRATLVHLERQSQGRADEVAWRWNLTLLNAWIYNRRFGRQGRGADPSGTQAGSSASSTSGQ